MPIGISNPTRLEALEQASTDKRYLNLSLVLRRKKTSEILLRVGGRWDRLKRQYVGLAKTCKIIDVEESQIEFIRWFADWLKRKKEDNNDRDRLMLAGGPRRAGKTFITMFAVIAAAIDQPNSINWAVGPTFQQRDELERLVKNWLPRSWFRYRDQPLYRFTLTNGSCIQLLSSDDPQTLKRGKANVVLYNETQNMDVGALSFGMPGIIDQGGLAILAANPPRSLKGEWILTLRDAIIEQTIPAAKFLNFSAGLNDQIDQHTRSDVGKILSVIDPKAAIADDEGQWLPVGDRAYPKFDKKRNVGTIPDLGDITVDWVKRKLGASYDYVAGVDFQGNPWHCSVVVKVFKGIDSNSPIYYVMDEQYTEGVEEDFLAEFADKDVYDNRNLFFVGDASGQFQAGDHTRGRQSFDIFKKSRWRIVPPVEKKTDKGFFSKNPNLDDRLNLVNKLLAQGRIIIDPNSCSRLIESLKDCELRMFMSRRRPIGRHAHITDALGYALFWLEPRTKIYRKASAEGISPINIPQTGPRLF